jgi:DNA-binding winged helix-turn-helix (wHTH) protein/TolB-like protein/Tfp pilus assembly protein PilF
MAAQRPIQIGDWRADPSSNELAGPGGALRIEPKVMQVLLILAGRPGGVVSREELLSQVWPGVVVGDEALTQAVIKLRRALNDNPRAPAYVETISKRGYRLIAPVGMGDPPAPSAPPPAPARPAMTKPGLVIVTLLVFFGGAYAVHLHMQSPEAPKVSEIAEQVEADTITVTVTPFESYGDTADQRYLARGISDGLSTDLSRLPGLRLITAPGPMPIGQTPNGARYLISGSVQRLADSLRINVHLIDRATGQELWSERFERPFSDLFAVQEEITNRLAALLPVKLNEAARQRLAKRYTRSLAAYDEFLRARSLFLVREPGDNEEARAHYLRAIELDPSFARAYAGLAMTYAIEYRLRPSMAAAPLLERARELAGTARQIDPDIPDVHWAVGFVQVQERLHERALQSLQRAIELNHSYADAYALMAGVYTYVGQPAKSIPLLRTAMRFNTDGGYLYFLILGRAYLFLNDDEQALINLREAASRNPVDLETRIYLAAALVAAGDQTAAEWQADEIRTLARGFSMSVWLDTYPLTDTTERTRLARLVARAGL